MTISVFVVLGEVEVMWRAYVPVLITVSGALIRKQYRVQQEVEVVSVFVERRLFSEEIH
jgi:hypothetical protein